jgi:hypothetical protein
VDDAIASQLISQVGITPSLKASPAALYEQAEGRLKFFRDVTYDRVHTFSLHPGLNVLVPPYDANVSVKLGSNKPYVQASAATGEFGVVATAMAGPTSGADSDVFRNPDSELIVSGQEYYVVTYSCRAGADSAKVRIGWWSAAFVKLHCRVPFVVIREF